MSALYMFDVVLPYRKAQTAHRLVPLLVFQRGWRVRRRVSCANECHGHLCTPLHVGMLKVTLQSLDAFGASSSLHRYDRAPEGGAAYGGGSYGAGYSSR